MMNHKAEQKAVMTLQAQAIWNDEKGCWDVVMTTFDTYHNLKGEYLSDYKVHHLDVEACNELVFTEALLYINGYSPLVSSSVKESE